MEAEEPEIVEYSTFVKDLTGEGAISEVEIYDFGREVELTYTTAEGELRATKSVYRLSDDELLAFTLDSRGVPFTVHAEEYPSKKSAGDWLISTSSILFLLLPVVLVIAVAMQAKAIRRISESLAAIIEERDRTRSDVDR